MPVRCGKSRKPCAPWPRTRNFGAPCTKKVWRASIIFRGISPQAKPARFIGKFSVIEKSVVILSPEPPYPLHGGGAFRIASLIHYFARFAQVDLILFSESGTPAVLPPG